MAGSRYWFDTQEDPLAGYYGQTEQNYGLPSGAIGGIVAAENTRPGVTSSAGAQTQFQIIPSTARDLGVNLSDPQSALQGAAKYWKQQLDTFGDAGLAYAAYNAGPGTVQKYLQGKGDLPQETRAYVKNALAYSKLRSDHFGDQGQEVAQATAAPQEPPPQAPMPVPVKPPAVSFPLPVDLAQDTKKEGTPPDRTYPMIMAALGLLGGRTPDLTSLLGGLRGQA